MTGAEPAARRGRVRRRGRQPVLGLRASGAITKEISTKGKESRFKKTDRGRFART